MGSPGRFGHRWRESKIEALEGELRQLHLDRTSPWDRHRHLPYTVNRFTEWLKIHPAVVLHLGRRQEEFLAEPGWDPFIHPEDLDRTDRMWLRCALVGRPYSGLEYRWRHAGSGNYVWLSETLYTSSWGRDAKPIEMGGWFENITPRRRAEIQFLLCCLDASRRWSAREARREIVARSRRKRTSILHPFPLGPRNGAKPRGRR